MAEQQLCLAHAPSLHVLGDCLAVCPLEGRLELGGAHAGYGGQIGGAQRGRTVVVNVTYDVVYALPVGGAHRSRLLGLLPPRSLYDEPHRLEDLTLVVQLAAPLVAPLGPEPTEQGLHLREFVIASQRGEGLLHVAKLALVLLLQESCRECGRYLD